MLASSAGLRRSGVRTAKLGGQDLVIFRTAGGEVAVLDAHCPHLGAHLGHGGRVVGESIRCPFHGFRFSADGRCVATPYPGNPEFTGRIRVWPVRERNGFVLVYYSATGEPPVWEVPILDQAGWLTPKTHSLTLPAHPQETSENSVDLGHFAAVHGYSDVRLVGKVELDGPRLHSSYVALRKFPGLPRKLRDRLTLRLEFDVEVWGLGYSLVFIHLPQLGFSARFWVLSTHTDGEVVSLTLASSTERRPTLRGWRRFLPWALMSRILREFILRQAVQDVRQDGPIWANKIHRDPPRLVKGDGPIGPYRRYARQFYPAEQAQHSVSNLAS